MTSGPLANHRCIKTLSAGLALYRGNSATTFDPAHTGAILRQTGIKDGDQVIRTYSLIIEGDSAGYSGYVPELPTILVTGSSIEDLTVRAKEAI